MLGNRIAHSHGHTTTIRVLDPGEHQAVLEISFQGTGEMLGQPSTDMGTVRFILHANGKVETESGAILIFGPHGEIARLKAAGIGKLTGPIPQGRYTTTGTFHTSADCWQELNEIIGIFEFVVDSQGDYTVQTWAWR